MGTILGIVGVCGLVTIGFLALCAMGLKATVAIIREFIDWLNER